MPRKSVVCVALLAISSRKGLLKQTVREELSLERAVSWVAVAAAAFVPASLTSTTAWWATCRGKTDTHVV